MLLHGFFVMKAGCSSGLLLKTCFVSLGLVGLYYWLCLGFWREGSKPGSTLTSLLLIGWGLRILIRCWCWRRNTSIVI